jgi:sortase A
MSRPLACCAVRLARVLGAIGRVCITAGVLILLFVAYQLWGTGIREAQAQNELEDQFAEGLANDNPVVDDSTTTLPADPAVTTTLPPAPPPPEEGDAAAHIVIPKIGVDKIVVEGVTLDDLKRGPGHYPDTPMPGQPGNSAIAGHRTTYGAPFHRIDELAEGDEILITTLQGTFKYLVTGQEIVSPSQVEVLDDFGDNRLTLTACHPKYSASQRIVVTAKLEEQPAPAPSTTAPPADTSDDGETGASRSSIDGGLSGERDSAWPAIWMGLACAAIWLTAWLIGRYTKLNKWIAYFAGAPFFFVMLFFFYENFARLLPANY